MGNFAEAGKIKDEMKKRDATRRENSPDISLICQSSYLQAW